MEIVLNIFYFLGGLAALYFGADYLVKGGSDIAGRFGISPLVIGLTLVAFATSAPELAVSVSSALQNNPGIAMGNVVGSNIANIGLILGICACIIPLNVNKRLLKKDVPLMIGAAVVLTLFYFMQNSLSRLAGGIFFCILLVDTVCNIVSSRKGSMQEENNGAVYPLYLAVIIVIASLGALVGGAKIFLLSAVYFAKLWHLSDAVIGLTVVAVGTSLPELATSVVAACKGEKDIALGNVIGSNIFNILGILGVTALIKPIPGGALNYIDFGVMGFFFLLLFVFMASGKTVSRMEGAILTLGYIGYTVYLVLCGTAV